MNQRYAVVVLLALILAASTTSFRSYRATDREVSEDMKQALALTMQEQQSDVISQDTIRTFNNHLRIAQLRGRATLAVDTRHQQFRAYAHCSEATILRLSDQRPALLLWVLTALWGAFCYQQRRRLAIAAQPLAAAITGQHFGGLTLSADQQRFFAADGQPVRLTPMQQQLMQMFFQSPNHALQKADICAALWPKKPDASETLYTLIRRLKPIVEQHSQLKIESERSKEYRLTIRQIAV